MEVDADLIWEFAQWVAYQLKNINYERLEFIDEGAFEALSNILALAIEAGEDLKKYMFNAVDDVHDFAKDTWNQIESDLSAANRRARLAGQLTLTRTY